jgi:hypothetical protein
MRPPVIRTSGADCSRRRPSPGWCPPRGTRTPRAACTCRHRAAGRRLRCGTAAALFRSRRGPCSGSAGRGHPPGAGSISVRDAGRRARGGGEAVLGAPGDWGEEGILPHPVHSHNQGSRPTPRFGPRCALHAPSQAPGGRPSPGFRAPANAAATGFSTLSSALPRPAGARHVPPVRRGCVIYTPGQDLHRRVPGLEPRPARAPRPPEWSSIWARCTARPAWHGTCCGGCGSASHPSER